MSAAIHDLRARVASSSRSVARASGPDACVLDATPRRWRRVLLCSSLLNLIMMVSACGSGSETYTSSPVRGGRPQETGPSSDASRPGARDGSTDASRGADEDENAPPLCPGGCADFPADPLVDPEEQITAAEIGRFGDADAFAPAEFCLMEPQLSTPSAPGALYPREGLRPRFRWTSGRANSLFEVRLHSAFERNDLIAYTRRADWTIPKEIWKSASARLRKVTATVRSLNSAGKVTGVRGTFHIAPVEVGGSIVFWATTSAEVGPATSKLHGFRMGDEAVVEVLSVAAVKTPPLLHENGRDVRGEYGGKPGFAPGTVQCIGCHTSTPDGSAVIFTDDYPWSKVVTSIEEGKVGTAPSFLSSGAQALLMQPWLGAQTTTPAHWKSGDRVVVASYGQRREPFSGYEGKDRLAWFDLETTARIPASVPPNGGPGPSRDEVRTQRNTAIAAAQGTAWGLIATEGETESAVTPSFSHDGTQLVYVATDRSPNGHPAYEANIADLKVVPYGDRAGGVAEPLRGASSPDFFEYHPSYSPDDRFVTFTRAPKRGESSDGPYYNRHGEIFVLPSSGADTPLRLAANDPVACSGQSSPGVINSWSKWAPIVGESGGRKYYFLVFSSAREAPGQFEIPRSQYTPSTLDTRSSQLHLATFVVEADGRITSYSAVYLWNQNRLATASDVQDVATSNLTPAWNDLTLPTTPLL